MSVEDRFRAAIRMAVYGDPIPTALSTEDRDKLVAYESNIRKILGDDDLREVPGGLLKDFEKRIISKFSLQFDRLALTQGYIHMQGNPGQIIEIPPETVTYWYRAASREEYQLMKRKNQFPKRPDYAGIASNFKYARSYVENEGTACMVVQWRIPPEGRLVAVMEEAGINFKPEDGAISYGLGETGTNGGKGAYAALDVFNVFCGPSFEVVYLRIPIRMKKLAA